MQIFSLLAVIASLGSFLLFVLEPMFGKMILPTLGGAANVWVAATMFYQIALFLGYAYVFLLSRLSLTLQWRIHVAAIILASFLLPISLPSGWPPPAGTNPVPSLLLMMFKTIGLPFCVLAGTAPLMHNWYSRSAPGKNPYGLYAFSNLGSFLALISYPFFIEPRLFLEQQSVGFAVIYVFWGIALASAGWLATKNAIRPSSTPVSGVTNKEIFWWVLLSAIPASLMLSTTSFITLDIGATPLFWLIPLGIYLLTFIVAFSEKCDQAYMAAALTYPSFFVLTAILLVLYTITGRSSTLANIFFFLLALAVFTVASLLCNCKLSKLKPESLDSMVFYLMLALGGAVGGCFNAIVAPLIFSDVYEYPIGLTLACVALPEREKICSLKAILISFVALVAAVISIKLSASGNEFLLVSILLMGLAWIAVFSTRKAPKAFIVSACAIFTSAILMGDQKGIILNFRNFYGRVRVSEDSDQRNLMHGTTVHGVMAKDQAHRLSPLSYYSPEGGLGEATRILNGFDEKVNVAVIGLGAGSLKCYGGKNWHFDFYEIDPDIAKIASDGRIFPYLSECPAAYSLIIGDGRLNIKQSPVHFYDEIVIDAFSSDSIPIHLLTLEAVQEFSEKIKPDGVLLFHLSNRFLDLAPLAAGIAYESRLLSVMKHHSFTQTDEDASRRFKFPSIVVAMSASQKKINELLSLGWKQPVIRGDVDPWRDGKSNLFSVLSWKLMKKMSVDSRD